MQASLRIEKRLICRGKDDAGSSDRRAHIAGLDDTHANGAACLVSGSRDHRRAFGQACGQCRAGRDFSHDLLRFKDLGQAPRVQVRGFHHLPRPAAMSDIEQQRAGSVRDVNGSHTRQLKADVIFWQEERAEALPDLRLMGANPHQLGQREVGEGWIRGQFDQPLLTDGLVEHAALLRGSLVTPDQGGAEDFFVLVEQDRAMHLSRQADCRDFAAGCAGLPQQPGDRLLACVPPVARVLLCPSILGRGKRRVLMRRRPEHGALFVNEKRARTARAYVDADDVAIHYRSPLPA